MQLMMYIGNDLIETITVDYAKLSIPGYLGGYKRQLKQKHKDLLLQSADQPEFLVIQMTPVAQTKSKAISMVPTTASAALSASYN